VNNLAILYSKREGLEDIQEAEKLFQRVLTGRLKILGETDQYTLMTMNNLAIVLEQQDKLAEAEQLFRRCVRGRESTLGSNHPDTIAAMTNLTNLLKLTGNSIVKLADIQGKIENAANCVEPRSEKDSVSKNTARAASSKDLNNLIGGSSNNALLTSSSARDGGSRRTSQAPTSLAQRQSILEAMSLLPKLKPSGGGDADADVLVIPDGVVFDAGMLGQPR
jgi:hypothetical protein